MPDRERPPTIHTNILLPFALASASFSTEILTSYSPRVGSVRTPNALYTSAVLIVIYLASPFFSMGMWMFRMERVDPIKMATVVLLVTIVFLGDTGIAEGDRVCAVIFYNIVLMLGAGMTFGESGLPEWTVTDKMKDDGSLNTTIVRCYRLAIALILFSGTVVLRKALWLCHDMRAHAEMYLDGDVVSGCAKCNAKTAFLLSFTSTAATVTAALATIRLKLEQSTLTLAFSSMLQCICVLCLYITQNQSIAHMPALFENGCFVLEQCPVAYEMRRTVSATHATGSTTFLALASMVLSGQLIDRSMRGVQQETQRTLFIIILLTSSAILAILIVFSASEFDSFKASIDAALLLTLAGVAVGSIVNEYLGAACIHVAIAIDFTVHYIQNIGVGVAMTYLTVVSNLACLALFVLLTIVLVVDRCFVQLTTLTQIITLCGRSVAWFLAVGSTSLFAVYDGGLLPQREEVVDPLVARTAFAFLLWHFAPIIAWIMIARRIPPTRLSRPTQLLFWGTAVACVGVTYLTALSISTGKLPSEYPITRLTSMAAALLLVVAPCWLCAL